MTGDGTASERETGAFLTITDIDLALQEPSAALVVVVALEFYAWHNVVF